MKRKGFGVTLAVALAALLVCEAGLPAGICFAGGGRSGSFAAGGRGPAA